MIATMEIVLPNHTWNIIISSRPCFVIIKIEINQTLVSQYVFLLRSVAISWGSKKQTIILRSTMEFELIALNTMSIEVEWIKNLLLHILLVSTSILAIFVYCDSKDVIDLVNRSHINKKMNKHIQVKYKLVRNLFSKNMISLNF